MADGTRNSGLVLSTRHSPLVTVSWLPAAGLRERARKGRAGIRRPPGPATGGSGDPSLEFLHFYRWKCAQRLGVRRLDAAFAWRSDLAGRAITQAAAPKPRGGERVPGTCEQIGFTSFGTMYSHQLTLWITDGNSILSHVPDTVLPTPFSPWELVQELIEGVPRFKKVQQILKGHTRATALFL